MQVFISIRVPRSNTQLDTLAQIVVNATQSAGHSPFLAYREILERGMQDSHVFMPFVRQEIQRCGLVIIVYNPELRGGLIEAGLAYAFEIPIWLIHQKGQAVSSSALGCANRVICYDHTDEIASRLTAAFAALN